MSNSSESKNIVVNHEIHNFVRKIDNLFDKNVDQIKKSIQAKRPLEEKFEGGLGIEDFIDDLY